MSDKEEQNEKKEVDVEDELLNSYGLDDDQKKAAKVHAAARDLYRHRQKLREEDEANKNKGSKTKHEGWRKFGA